MSFDRKNILKEAKSKVFVITEHYEFIGLLHLVNIDRRESDVLNDEKPFIHLTDVEVRVKATGKSSQVPFVAINKRNVICVIPFESSKSTQKE
ncbi:MAG TPA: hypothetical protein ENH32_05790 [Proteobacteria bacterium]|nr:hypothetical protein BMS3Abin14_01830 [bacterium BMS3Abin14]HDL53468.1 hypothetical protein [Pseudomonadota bacterium]